jgi:hypothetical protein
MNECYHFDVVIFDAISVLRMKNVKLLNPKEIRTLIRKGNWDKPTAGLAMDTPRPIS